MRAERAAAGVAGVHRAADGVTTRLDLLLARARPQRQIRHEDRRPPSRESRVSPDRRRQRHVAPARMRDPRRRHDHAAACGVLEDDATLAEEFVPQLVRLLGASTPPSPSRQSSSSSSSWSVKTSPSGAALRRASTPVRPMTRHPHRPHTARRSRTCCGRPQRARCCAWRRRCMPGGRVPARRAPRRRVRASSSQPQIAAERRLPATAQRPAPVGQQPSAVSRRAASWAHRRPCCSTPPPRGGRPPSPRVRSC